jgi:hypothetical protein
VRQEVSRPRGGPVTPSTKDPPHGRLTDLAAKAGQLAVHPAVSPRWVFARRLQHQVADLPACPPGGPAVPDTSTCG